MKCLSFIFPGLLFGGLIVSEYGEAQFDPQKDAIAAVVSAQVPADSKPPFNFYRDNIVYRTTYLESLDAEKSLVDQPKPETTLSSSYNDQWLISAYVECLAKEAQVSTPEDIQEEVASTDCSIDRPEPAFNSCCNNDGWLLAAYFEYLGGNGVGYRGNYTTLGGMLFPGCLGSPSCCCAAVQPFIDIRTHAINNRNTAVNAGGGVRVWCPSFNKIFGLNLYYDYRFHRKAFNQLGLGLEALSVCGDLFDMRMNFYLPVGDKMFSSRPHTFNFPGGFFVVSTKRQRALKGIDFEIDTQLCRFGLCNCSCFDIYMGAGWYYYNDICSEKILGAKGRLGLQLDCFYLEFRITYDPVFKTRAQGLVSFVYYFGGKKPSNCCNSCDYLKCYLRQPVLRQEIIVQGKKRCFFETNF